MKKKLMAAVLAAYMVIPMASPVYAAKDKKDDVGTVMDAFTPYEETVTFTRGVQGNASVMNFPEGDSFKDNVYTRFVKEKLNVEPQAAWETDSGNYSQKVALSITSGDIPDVLQVGRTTFKQMVENDLIADVTDVYEACISDELREMYDSYGQELFDQVSVDGRMYGIPATSLPGQHNLLWIRQDWLDKLGLEAPTTVEELEEVAKAFVEQDPGGNGEGQTIGLTLAADGESGQVWTKYNVSHGANTIFSAYGAYPGNWIDVDGEVQYGSIQPEMKKGLEVLHRFYEEGILDKEFAVRKSADRDELVASGRVGILFCPWWGYSGIPESIGNNKDAEWTIISGPVDENGNLNVAANDPLQDMLVIRKGYEHPEAIIKTLNVCYSMYKRWDEEGAKILDETAPNMLWSAMPNPIQIGYKDSLKRQRENVKEAVEARDPGLIKDIEDVSIYNSIVACEEAEDPKEDIWLYQEWLVRTKGIDAAIADNVKIKDVEFYGQTDSMPLKWSNLEKLEVETYIQIITGEQPVDYFDTFVENWKAQGGDDITAEVNEECAKKG